MTSWHRKKHCIFLTLCEGNPPATGRFPSQRANNIWLWCFIVVNRNMWYKRLSCLWFEKPWRSCDQIWCDQISSTACHDIYGDVIIFHIYVCVCVRVCVATLCGAICHGRVFESTQELSTSWWGECLSKKLRLEKKTMGYNYTLQRHFS